MRKEQFKPGLQFRVKGNYTDYRLHRSTMGHLFITRKGNVEQGHVMKITDEGFVLGCRAMDHVACVFVFFHNLETWETSNSTNQIQSSI